MSTLSRKVLLIESTGGVFKRKIICTFFEQFTLLLSQIYRTLAIVRGLYDGIIADSPFELLPAFIEHPSSARYCSQRITTASVLFGMLQSSVKITVKMMKDKSELADSQASFETKEQQQIAEQKIMAISDEAEAFANAIREVPKFLCLDEMKATRTQIIQDIEPHFTEEIRKNDRFVAQFYEERAQQQQQATPVK